MPSCVVKSCKTNSKSHKKYHGITFHLCVFLLPPVLLFLLVIWPTIWWSMVIRKTAPELRNIKHSPKMQSLDLYLKNICVLIEPAKLPCSTLLDAQVVVLVATSSPHGNLREAVRETWGFFQPTYFVMGRIGDWSEQIVANRLEASQFDDLIVFDFDDHHLNQTLKTALMMKWTVEQCPNSQYLFKTQEGVMVNPWMLNRLLQEHQNAQLIGYSLNDSLKLGSEHIIIQKLLHADRSMRYLSGTGYLIRTDYIPRILKKAYQVPFSLEDVYFTFLVAHKQLGLTLDHDRRLSPYKPWLQIPCVYWNQASVYSLSPKKMLHAWYYLEDLVVTYNNVGEICERFNTWLYAFGDHVLY